MEILRLFRVVGLYGEHNVSSLMRDVNLKTGDWQFYLTTLDGESLRVATPGEAIYRDIDEAYEKVDQVNLLVITRYWPALLPAQVESMDQVGDKLPKSPGTKAACGLELSGVADCYSKDSQGFTLNEQGRSYKASAESSVDVALGRLSTPVENYLAGLKVPVVPAKMQNPVKALLDGQALHGRAIRFAIGALPFSRQRDEAAVLLAQGTLFDSMQVEDVLFASPSKALIEALTRNELVSFPVGVIYQLMQHTKRPRPDIHIPYDWMSSKTVEKMCYCAVEQNSPKCCEHLLKWDVLQGNKRFQPLRELLLNRLEGDFKAKYQSQ
jgi:hypothetical protein